jgi:hypothetical protein
MGERIRERAAICYFFSFIPTPVFVRGKQKTASPMKLF